MTAAQASQASQATAYYLYGVMAARGDLPGDLVGVGGARDLVLLDAADLALLASPIEAGRDITTRDDLLAHSRVLDAVAARSDVLPLRFGTVADEGTLEAGLGPALDRYAELLAELAGAVQYTLRARYLEEPLLREIVAEDPEIEHLSTATREQPVYGQSVRLGELVVGVLGRKAAADAAAMLDALDPHIRAVESREPGTPEDVLDAALLVDRTGHTGLEEAVESLGKRESARMRLRLIGPQAPYDFVPGD
ncbi:MAG: GvpL/GvpF family gas vesicle protein [Streptosporangiales bacterium]